METSAEIAGTEDDALIALRTFLLSVLPAGTEITRGQDNRVGLPQSVNYAVMVPMLRDRLSTNVVSLSDQPGRGTRTSRQSTQFTVQVDLYGPAASDGAQVVSTLVQDGYAAEQFARYGAGVQVLYAGTPRNMQFLNSESQYEERWTVDVVLQFSPAVTVPQDFADRVEVSPRQVDALPDANPVPGSADVVDITPAPFG